MVDSGRWYKDIFHIYWLDESQTVLVLEFEEDYTWLDYYELMQLVAEMIVDIHHPIVYINIWREHVKVPTDSTLPHFKNMKQMFLPEAVVLLMHNTDQIPIIEMFSNAIGFERDVNYWFVSSYDDAMELAQEKYALLNH